MGSAARWSWIGWRLFRQSGLVLAICLGGAAPATAREPPTVEDEPPRVQALLEQAWAAETGRGLRRNPALAADLYRQAGLLGSAEGYYRLALIYLPGGKGTWLAAQASCYLAAASHLGHRRAADLLERAAEGLPVASGECGDGEGYPGLASPFDLEGYLGGLPVPKRRAAELIRRLAPVYSVDVHLALAVAAVESNFNSAAVSPKLAMGVMQLIPATAERFGVRKPFDPEQNIRGGLAYLRWLGNYYQGDIVKVIAAYNAGEKAVDSYMGIPPYAETMAYVARVLSVSGREVRNLSVRFPGKGSQMKATRGGKSLPERIE